MIKFSPQVKLDPTMNDWSVSGSQLSSKKVAVSRVFFPVAVQGKVHVADKFWAVGRFLENISRLVQNLLRDNHSFASFSSTTDRYD